MHRLGPFPACSISDSNVIQDCSQHSEIGYPKVLNLNSWWDLLLTSLLSSCSIFSSLADLRLELLASTEVWAVSGPLADKCEMCALDMR